MINTTIFRRTIRTGNSSSKILLCFSVTMTKIDIYPSPNCSVRSEWLIIYNHPSEKKAQNCKILRTWITRLFAETQRSRAIFYHKWTISKKEPVVYKCRNAINRLTQIKFDVITNKWDCESNASVSYTCWLSTTSQINDDLMFQLTFFRTSEKCV